MAQFNFRLFLRPTAVGKLIIDRLMSEGIDRQAEARRWMELGYLCEQAGLRLDGSTLLQPGRTVAADPLVPTQVPVHTLPVPVPLVAVATVQPAPSAAPLPAAPTEMATTPATVALRESPIVEPSATQQLPTAQDQLGSELTLNLRALAH